MSAMEIVIPLAKSDNQQLGFRLSGGVDFCFPLTVVRVTIGGVADQAGVHAGDVVVKINGEAIQHLTHNEFQQRLIKAGNKFTLTVLRNLKFEQVAK